MTIFQEIFYMILTAIFIASLVTCNLIYLKFFIWPALGIPNFALSVGIIAYPVTFIVTDLISELYGKRRANQVVLAGFFASIFTVVLVYVAMVVPIAPPSPLLPEGSPVDQATFKQVFGLSGASFFGSMVAYLTAQFIDIRLFHFWKRLTECKYLWLRNNASTMCSQLVDTSVVLFILCSAGAISWGNFYVFLWMGWMFKVLVALIDTPIIYFCIWLLRDKIQPVSHLEEN